MVQHALVLGSSGHVHLNPTKPAQLVDTALQSDPSQKSDKSKSPGMAPRASALKGRGFSEAVAAGIEDPQEVQPDQFMRQGDHFYKWCITNQVDFKAPPCKVSC